MTEDQRSVEDRVRINALKNDWEEAAHEWVDSMNNQEHPEVMMRLLIFEIVRRTHLLIVANGPDIDPVGLLRGWDMLRVKLIVDIAQNPEPKR